jgi:hypothetical protein
MSRKPIQESLYQFHCHQYGSVRSIQHPYKPIYTQDGYNITILPCYIDNFYCYVDAEIEYHRDVFLNHLNQLMRFTFKLY